MVNSLFPLDMHTPFLLYLNGRSTVTHPMQCSMICIFLNNQCVIFKMSTTSICAPRDTIVYSYERKMSSITVGFTFWQIASCLKLSSACLPTGIIHYIPPCHSFPPLCVHFQRTLPTQALHPLVCLRKPEINTAISNYFTLLEWSFPFCVFRKLCTSLSSGSWRSSLLINSVKWLSCSSI